jgi:hypothetical protein
MRTPKEQVRAEAFGELAGRIALSRAALIFVEGGVSEEFFADMARMEFQRMSQTFESTLKAKEKTP